MLKKKLIGYIMLLGCSVALAKNVSLDYPELEPLKTFFLQQAIPSHDWPQLEYLKQAELPQPYNIILEQPLLTVAISHYYQRTPKIRPPLYAVHNAQDKTYSRAIVMIIDKNKNRDDALQADKTGESQVTELGLITINFAALPHSVIDGVVQGQIPFGALLKTNHVKVHEANSQYFKIVCDALLSKYLPCNHDKVLYGRINSLINDNDGQWVAKVVTILSNMSLPVAS